MISKNAETGKIETKATLKFEIIAILGLIMPLVNPLTGFAFGVAGTVSSSSGTDIKFVADSIVNTATLLVSPVGPVLDSLL